MKEQEAFAPAEPKEPKNTSACAKNLRLRLQTPILKDTATVCFIISQNNKEVVNMSQKSVNEIPAYWEEYLDEKIATINKLREEGDCFSFIVLTDMHYPRNTGKLSPLLAKKILDSTNTGFALCLGDVQTSHCHDNKEEAYAEIGLVEEMLLPIRDRLLLTEGNHDGVYGWLYYDKDGNPVDSTSEDIAQKRAYVTNISPKEMYDAFYKKVALMGGVTFDEGGGNGYWKDDVKSKARFIMLNSCFNEYELLEDGSAKYPKMRIPKFSQSQFDMLINALNTVPDESWIVVVAAHHPLDEENHDKELMSGVLGAYKNKTSYKGERTFKDEHVTVDCDFSDAKGDIAGYFYGHVHYDGNYVLRNIQMIATSADTSHEDMVLSLRKRRLPGTTDEQSFDVFTIDREKHKIYATKIGAGNDREIDF